MILNQLQAEAVYSAMCALSNVGVTRLVFDSPTFDVTTFENGELVIASADELETYGNQAAFAEAYNLQ